MAVCSPPAKRPGPRSANRPAIRTYDREVPVPSSADVTAALATVLDPEIRKPITELNMVSAVDVQPDGTARVDVLLTVPGCPMKEQLTRDVTAAVSRLDG